MRGFLWCSQWCSQGYDRSSVTDARQTKGGTGGLDFFSGGASSNGSLS
jgi:hypothetical protein